jgi:MerR family transcriptional regulator, thiopeptide resistance regulator
MLCSVGEVARLTGLTVRTRHHYDEIGLLKPAERTDADYRMYGEAELLRLHDILLWREVGMPLDEIARVLDDPDYDLVASLQMHRRHLVSRAVDLESRIEGIDRLLERMEGGVTMDEDLIEEIFDGFKPAEYDDEARQKWGETEAYANSRKRADGYDADDWRAVKQESDEIMDGFADLLRNGVAADSSEASGLVLAHRRHISRFYEVTPEIHCGLGDMYVQDPRFTATYDAVEPGLARYVRDAIHAAD